MKLTRWCLFFFIQGLLLQVQGKDFDLNKILLIGGKGVNECSAGYTDGSMEIYDPRNPDGNKELPTRLLTPRWGHISEVLGDGRVLIAGGRDVQNNELSSTEIYDLVSGTVVQGPSMNENRSFANSAFLNGNLYVCGGYNGNNELATCEKFDSDKWQPIASLNRHRSGFIMEPVSGSLLACAGLGGRPDGWNLTQEEVRSCEAYNPQQDTWQLVQPINNTREDAAAAELNGNVYVCGGDGTTDKSCEVYDPSTNVWSPGADMNLGRLGFALINMNGKLYAIGGKWKDTVEEFDPQAGQSWKVLDRQILRGRRYFSAVAL